MNSNQFQNIDPDRTTVGELVAENYHAAGVLREYGMDFCCGGGITLQSACEEKGANLTELIERLSTIPWNQSEAGESYKAWSPDYLIQHIIKRHHRFVREKTVEIGVYAAKVASVHGENHPENIEIYQRFNTLSKALLVHLEAEENLLFPLVMELYEDRMEGRLPRKEVIRAIQEELESMEADHEEAGALMAEIRQLSRDYNPPADACATYRVLYQNLSAFEEDLHLHVHLENNILFRKAEKMLGVLSS